MTRIAIVGMACQYPDANTPVQLWENAVAGRRAFRRLPDVRMRLDDYWDADPTVPDKFYARNAAVIEGYQFDRVAYKIAGSTYRSTDLTHWLALDVAAKALADAGFTMGEGLPLESTGVVVGNSLTGEFARANLMRLRWPYVRRTVAAALSDSEWDTQRIGEFLDGLEERYKSPFPEIDEDTLAGGLSNTIAGRICNYFNLKGGGYTVDGACSSSLLSVATACQRLVDGDIDVAVAGGVDLSIDPFEIIGFAKTGALAMGEMRVYDKGANGFWPGEGCGMTVLMREQDARRARRPVYATIAGWGISSDGKGGITRPEVVGYQLALRRAYERAGFGVNTVALFEGHGTGTKVGDSTELRALADALQSAGGVPIPSAISSIKAMIGHTKAAAGVAGLIKASMSVHHEVLPPALGCPEPHELFAEDSTTLRLLRKAEAWPTEQPVRAGITAMGFGGINTHIVLENPRPRKRKNLTTNLKALAASVHDVELLALDAATPQELSDRLGELAEFVATVSYAQLGDLAAGLHAKLNDRPFRAVAVVNSPEDARRRLEQLRGKVDAGEITHFAADGRSFLGHVSGPGHIGFLFPGQGSGRGMSGGALRRRFAEAESVYTKASLPTGADVVATEVAQPRIVTGSLAGLRVLTALGIEATVAVGHSLGEISALCWAQSLDERALSRVAAVRGKTMSERSSSGTMAGIGASADAVSSLLADSPVVIAGYNSPDQTVVAGAVSAVDDACARARAAGFTATRLAVSHAFHSPLVAPAADAFGKALAKERFREPKRRVVSTVTGEALSPDTDLVALLHRQITDPVLFSQAVTIAAKEVDLFVEVGPGRVLAGLASATTEVPAVSLDTDDESLAGLLRVVGAAYVVGAAKLHPALFEGRLIRPLEIGAEFSFFASPCEAAPTLNIPLSQKKAVAAEQAGSQGELAGSSLEVLLELSAERAELPVDLVRPESRLLDDLHLSSITVGQIVNQVARRMGLDPAGAPTNFATATVRELAEAMDTLAETATGGDAAPDVVAGAGVWARPWRVDLDETPLPAHRTTVEPAGRWRVYAQGDHPLCEPLRRALEQAEVGSGVLVCLPQECTEDQIELALHGAKAALSGAAGDRFVLVQNGWGAAGLAKTLRLEAPHVRTTIVHVPVSPQAVDWVVAEVSATTRFSEAFYDEQGVRRIPMLRALPMRPARTTPPLAESDVLLVTGGGKGITAECALAMVENTGAKLALLGRSDPGADTELAANLARMKEHGVDVAYARADVTDREQVRRAITELAGKLGPVTAILHGAGRNEPAAVSNLDPATIRSTFAPKIDGLRAVVDAVDMGKVRLLVTLGSIIGRAGLRGEAHYATANEWLAHLTEQIGQTYPDCRAICLEWSVWSGVGMGERLSVVESLTREGITAIAPDQGIRVLRRLLEDPDTPGVVVISGRTDTIDTVGYDLPPLPLLRFVDRPLVRYHNVELVCETELSAGTDLYLSDHLLDGNLLFPAVFGMEAMAQIASAMTGREQAPIIENAEFLRPIVVPPAGSTKIRIAAVATDDDSADVVIRSSETNFAADHFRARLRWQLERDSAAPDGPPEQAPESLGPVPLEPQTDLYGDTLFQGGRFQRLRRYHRAAARDVDVELAAMPKDWFAGYLPGRLLLGDPGVRDALMHGNQVCVPDATLLPSGIERIYAAGEALSGDRPVRACAVERSRDGDTYIYDIALRDQAGAVIERWEGLRLQAVRKRDGGGPWVTPLLSGYLERAVGDLLGASVAVAVRPGSDDSQKGSNQKGSVQKRRSDTATALGHALGHAVKVRYRPDGRPEISRGPNVSAAHGAGVVLAVAGAGPIGCDVEPVRAKDSEEWSGLLGSHAELARLVASTTGESEDTAATRVWCALESLQKAGVPTRGPVTLLTAPGPQWTVFTSGDVRIATLATTLRDHPEPVVFAVLATRQG